MSDSVDRVFVHALNTVKKMPGTGTGRPAPEERLRLYGLYKQSMEGDVASIASRPAGRGEQLDVERQKWDAWSSQRGLSKTEAKRRYISLLIEMMHRYAGSSADARELVSELEYLWDQIKSNDPSSSSSPSHLPRSEAPLSAAGDGGGGGGGVVHDPGNQDAPMRMLSPNSEQDEEEDDEDDDEDEQYDDAQEGEDIEDYVDVTDKNSAGLLDRTAAFQRKQARIQRRWRRRVEDALARLTVEVAALREQGDRKKGVSYETDDDDDDHGGATRTNNDHNESNAGTGGIVRRPSWVGLTRRTRRRARWLWRWMVGLVWASLKHLLVDLVIVALVWAWMRRRRDQRSQMMAGFVRGLLVEQLRRLRVRLR